MTDHRDLFIGPDPEAEHQKTRQDIDRGVRRLTEELVKMSSRDPEPVLSNLVVYVAPQVTCIARPSFELPDDMPVNFLGHPPADDGELLAEFAGRLCYMSHKNPANKTTAEYLDNIKKQGHGSVLEHASYSFLLQGVSRSFSHELVRHRAGFAYSQLSQRYVDEAEVGFVVPPAILDLGGNSRSWRVWIEQMQQARRAYKELADELMLEHHDSLEKLPKTERRKKVREAARSVLPNSTETKLVVTANARAWRTMLELRCNEGAEREIRRCMLEVLKSLWAMCPAFFSDWEFYLASDGHEAARPEYRKV